MEAIDYIEKVRAAGFDLRTETDRLLVFPVELLSDQQRQFLRAHKIEILAALRASESLLDAEGGHDLGVANDADCLPLRLMKAASRVCREVHGDSSEQVQAMLDDLRHTPPSDWDALTDHFESQLSPTPELGWERDEGPIADHGHSLDAPIEHPKPIRASVQYRLKDGGGGGSLLGSPGTTDAELRAVLAEKYSDRLATIDGAEVRV